LPEDVRLFLQRIPALEEITMSKLWQIVQSVFATIASGIGWTAKTCWDGTHWTTKMVAEHVVEPLVTFANHVMRVSQNFATTSAKAASAGTKSAPGLAWAGARSGRS
jgi:hypothetical protein